MNQHYVVALGWICGLQQIRHTWQARRVLHNGSPQSLCVQCLQPAQSGSASCCVPHLCTATELQGRNPGGDIRQLCTWCRGVPELPRFPLQYREWFRQKWWELPSHTCQDWYWKFKIALVMLFIYPPLLWRCLFEFNQSCYVHASLKISPLHPKLPPTWLGGLSLIPLLV